MGVTVAVSVEHLPTACIAPTTAATNHCKVVLIPNLSSRAMVKSTLKRFIRENLYIPNELQSLVAPLFTRFDEHEFLEDIYCRYCCSAEVESSDLHVDEESLTFFGRERGRSVELQDEDRLDERHVIDGAKLQLKRLPQYLQEQGGRIFVETKDGVLPILGVRPTTQISEIKRILETMTGVHPTQQLLYSVGRVMHDDLFLRDFDGFQTVYEDSTLDLCKSGDSNSEQAHRRMVVIVNVMGDQHFSLIVQGRDLVQVVMQVIESRTGLPQWQQRITFSGRVLPEKKTLADFFIYPDCSLDVSIFKSPLKPSPRRAASGDSQESADNVTQKPAARKFKLVRTCNGLVKGSLTIPVLTSDTVLDLKRKIKRTLHPLVERNFLMRSPSREQQQQQPHIEIAGKFSAATGNLRPSCLSSPFGEQNLNQVLSPSPLHSMTKTIQNPTSLKSPAKSPHASALTPSSPQDQAGRASSFSGSPSTRTPPSSSSPASRPDQCKQHQECPPVSPLNPPFVRRLQFSSVGQNPFRPKSWVPPFCLPPQSQCRSGTEVCHEDAETESGACEESAGVQEEEGDEGGKRGMMGGWLSGSVRTLKEQIEGKLKYQR